ncbi:MAG: hypothetical protein ABL893_19495 [Hyphomicrobium sp.]
MLHPKAWLDSIRIRDAVANYPIYAPPHKLDYKSITALQSRENYSYFDDQRAIRLAHFSQWIDNFGISATIDNAGIQSISGWIHRYAGHLLTADIYSSRHLYSSFTPVWSGSHRGLNVIWDLGIYAGDWIVQQNPACSWALNTGDEDPVSRNMTGFRRPCILIQKRPGVFPVFNFLFDVAVAKRDLVTIGAIRIGDPNTPCNGFELQLRDRAARS